MLWGTKKTSILVRGGKVQGENSMSLGIFITEREQLVTVKQNKAYITALAI